MSKRKNPHPAGGTAEQGEHGAVWADSSHDSDFTSGGAGRQGRIVELLLSGEENAIPASDLARMAGYSNTRSLRAAVDREREKIGIIQYLPARRGITFLLRGIVELEKCGSLFGAQTRGPLLIGAQYA